jgi:alanine racemase
VRAFPGVVPVVKGNGYGFGRARLAAAAGELGAEEVAVGTAHELADLPPGAATRIVLTPALAAELREVPLDAVVTVGSRRQLEELVRSGTAAERRVIVKLRSSMGRYGLDPTELAVALADVEAASAAVHGVAVHPPLAGSSADHAVEVTSVLAAAAVPEDISLYVSHLDEAAYASLRSAHPLRPLRIRLGTALWHGDKSFLHLGADVLDARRVHRGERLGYRLVEVAADGWLVLASAGTAHGVHPLPDGRSPFHFQRQRLSLLEPPHMHTSMLLAPCAGPVPAVGDVVDVQRPLTQTLVDRVVEC